MIRKSLRKGALPSPYVLIPPCKSLVSSLCHVFSRGTDSDLLNEALTAVSGPCLASTFGYLEPIENAIYKYFSSCVRIPTHTLDYGVIALQKDPSTSTGFPWKNYFSNWKQMLDELDPMEDGASISDRCPEVFVQSCEELEAMILGKRAYLPIFYLFGKKDKYSFNKITSQQFRTIQVSDVYLFMIITKYWGHLLNVIETNASQFYLITDSIQYQLKYLERCYNFGPEITVDYKRYDKSEVSEILYSSLRVLQRLKPMPEEIYSWVVSAVVNSVLVLQDASMTMLINEGSLLSGIATTSYSNSYTHLVHNCFLLERIFGCSYADYLNDDGPMRSLVTGDDGREAFSRLEYAYAAQKYFPGLLKEWFGIEAKIGGVLYNGEVVPYPNGVPSPYLGNVDLIWLHEGDWFNCVRLPYHFSRQMCSACFYKNDQLQNGSYKDKMVERMQGILASTAGFYYVVRHLPSIAQLVVPDHWLRFAEVAYEIGCIIPDDTFVANLVYRFNSSLSRPTTANLRYRIRLCDDVT